MRAAVDLPLEELRFRLRGQLYEPLVACCSVPEDVVAALAFARERGLAVAVRGRGDSLTGGPLGDDGLVIDVRGMREVEIDPEREVALVGAGVTGAEIGSAARAHGLMAGTVRAVQLVTAEGEIVRAAGGIVTALEISLRPVI